MADIKNLRILGFSIRGAPHHPKVRLSGKELLQVVVFLLILVVLFLIAMYVGWWTLQQEEKAERQHQHARAGWDQAPTPWRNVPGVE